LDLSAMLFQEVHGKSTPGNNLQTKRERNKLLLTVIPLLELIRKSHPPPSLPSSRSEGVFTVWPPKNEL